MFRNNEVHVSKLFNKNRKTIIAKTVRLESDPRRIEIKISDENVNQNKHHEETQETNSSAKDIKIAEKEATERYSHEKRKIRFMMLACRRLRCLSKEKSHLGLAANGLVYVGLLLMKKGIMLNLNAINTIALKKNDFELAKFETFLKGKINGYILNELKKDMELYSSLLKHLQKKMIEEVGLEDPTAK